MNYECPYCKEKAIIFLKSHYDNKIQPENIDYSTTEISRLGSNKFPPKPNLFKCTNCEIIFSEFYNIKFEKKYIDVIDQIYIDQIKYKKLYFKNLIKKIKKELSKEKDVLEIGSYYGAFGSEVLEYVKSYTGLELSTHAVNFSKEKYKLEIFKRTTDEHFKISSKYDVIFMFDVIEHLDDPIEVLKACNNKLKKNGILIFSTMNMNSFVARILGTKYPWVMLIHKYYFTNNSLKKILKKTNFDLYKIKYDTRIIGIEHFLDKIQIHFPFFKYIFNVIRKFKFIKDSKIKVSFFDLNIYFARKN